MWPGLIDRHQAVIDCESILYYFLSLGPYQHYKGLACWAGRINSTLWHYHSCWTGYKSMNQEVASLASHRLYWLLIGPCMVTIPHAWGCPRPGRGLLMGLMWKWWFVNFMRTNCLNTLTFSPDAHWQISNSSSDLRLTLLLTICQQDSHSCLPSRKNTLVQLKSHPTGGSQPLICST